MQPTPRGSGVWVEAGSMTKPAARWSAQASLRWAALLLAERKLRQAFADATVFIVDRAVNTKGGIGSPELTLQRQ